MNAQVQPTADAPLEAALFEPVIAAVKTHGNALRSIPGVLGVRPGLRMAGGELTPDPVIVVLTQPGGRVGDLPMEVDGLSIQVREAGPLEIVEGLSPLSMWEGLLPEAIPLIHYTPPDPTEVALAEIRANAITCHVGPDSGWATLKPFLEVAATSLTVAMYEFDAEHIIEAMTHLGAERPIRLNMILQVSSNDQSIEAALRESWGSRLDFARAVISGPQRIFNSAYHTKVAVRDSKAIWLSSGNWSPNSQPMIIAGDEPFLYRKGNREWHVIIENEALAQMYEKFILHDMRQAREAGTPEAAVEMPDLLLPLSALEPEAALIQDHPFTARTFAASGRRVRVMPLLSPDNYAHEILKLIQAAERNLYLQFSYIRQPSSEVFDEIITTIAGKMQAGLDVRILVSNNQKTEHTERLVGVRGWRPEMIRRQTSRMHNKGILVDGKIAVVGSHNWSSDGTQYNRDASLVFYSRPIARYFKDVFLFDWDNLSKPVGSQPEVTPMLAPEMGSIPAGMVRISWRDWYDE